MIDMPWNTAQLADWRPRIAHIPMQSRARLAARARSAPLFAHAYAFHLNMRFGGMTPLHLAEFAKKQGLSGLKVHVEDGEGASLARMSDTALRAYAMAVTDLELHVETSTTEAAGLADAVRIALATGATDRKSVV